MKEKVAIISLGCAKNQVDAEIMLYQLKKAGYTIASEPAHAKVVIINTCGFIESAKAEALENIFEVAKLKAEAESCVEKIIVSGCLSQRYQGEIIAELPEVDAFLGVASRDRVADAVAAVLAGKNYADFEPISNYKVGGGRILSTPPYTAYLKIADGCSNRCTYCAIPYIRGDYKSRPIEEIAEEARGLAADGVFELNLIAQDTTRYGLDIYGKWRLADLLRELCKIDGFKWIRILYAYPDSITDELIDVMAENEKIVPYIDLPLQHASDKMLSAMNRRSTNGGTRRLIEKIRAKMPNAVLRTTFIVGFPGETDEDFEELCKFTEDIGFDKVGVFEYSPEDGTPAAEMEQTVSEELKAERREILENVASRVVDAKNEAFVGRTLEVVCEGFDRLAECYYGRSREFAPEVDGGIFFKCERKLRPGQLVNVRVDEVMDYDFIGEAVL